MTSNTFLLASMGIWFSIGAISLALVPSSMAIKAPLSTMSRFVGEHSVKFTVGYFHFIDGKFGANIVRKQHPAFGVVFLIPFVKTGQVVFVLFLKFFNGKLLAFWRLSIGQLLQFPPSFLKNQQIFFQLGAGGKLIEYPALNIPVALPVSSICA